MSGGSESAKNRILIDENGFLSIRDNIFHALTRLPTKEPRLLWIDAICINQEDKSERNHQVAQMGRIYAQAKKCSDIAR